MRRKHDKKNKKQKNKKIGSLSFSTPAGWRERQHLRRQHTKHHSLAIKKNHVTTIEKKIGGGFGLCSQGLANLLWSNDRGRNIFKRWAHSSVLVLVLRFVSQFCSFYATVLSLACVCVLLCGYSFTFTLIRLADAFKLSDYKIKFASLVNL